MAKQMTAKQYAEAVAWREKASPQEIKLYDEALALLSDYFNDGDIPENLDSKGGWLLGVATIFSSWAQDQYKQGLKEGRDATSRTG